MTGRFRCSSSVRMEGEGGSRRAAEASAVLPIPDELIVEIFARLPAESLCLCKCVSRTWHAFIYDPGNRSRFAQTLSGLFFSRSYGSRPTWDFIGLSMTSVLPPPPGVDTDLSFLSPACELLDSCNGLLLLRSEESRQRPPSPPYYVVCNPATGERVTLPQPSRVPGLTDYSDGVNLPIDTSTAALGFDPSISPHFHVFQLVKELDHYEYIVWAVEIYSSRTGRWVLSKNEFDRDTEYVQYIGQMTYFKGSLHFCMIGNSVVSVDTEGQRWRISRVRQNGGGHGSSVCHSQGHLIYVDGSMMSHAMPIYVLEDHDSEEWVWIFKQSIHKPDLFGPRTGHIWDFYTAAFHPDSDMIFFYDWSQKRLVSYDMKHRDVHVICTLEVPYFEFQPTNDVQRKFFPYVPLYSGALPSSIVS